MRRFLNFLYDAAGTLAAFFVFAIFAVMIGGTVMRELGLRTGGSDDLVAWFCAASAFLAMAHTFRWGDFVRVTLLLENLGPRTRHAFEIASLAVAACAIETKLDKPNTKTKNVVTFMTCPFLFPTIGS